MDRALLERMVGAVALVLLLVVVAPALLDGTSDPGASKFANNAEEDVRTQVIVLNEPRIAKEPEKAEQAPDVIAPGPPPESVKPAEKKPPALEKDRQVAAPSEPVQVNKKTATPVATGTVNADTTPVRPRSGAVTAANPEAVTKPSSPAAAAASNDSGAATGFAVQLGSFGQLENARKYAAAVGARGFPAFVRSSNSAAGGIHRVYVGPRPSRDAAAKLAAVLGDAGYKGIVVDLSGNAGSGGR